MAERLDTPLEAKRRWRPQLDPVDRVGHDVGEVHGLRVVVQGLVTSQLHEVADHLRAGRLRPVLPDNPILPENPPTMISYITPEMYEDEVPEALEQVGSSTPAPASGRPTRSSN